MAINGARMTLNELAQQCGEDSRRWFPATANDLGYMTLALNGEAGELANIVKKIERGSLDIRDASVKLALMSETTDVLVYLANIADILHMDIDKMYRTVRANNEKRFGNARNN